VSFRSSGKALGGGGYELAVCIRPYPNPGHRGFPITLIGERRLGRGEGEEGEIPGGECGVFRCEAEWGAACEDWRVGRTGEGEACGAEGGRATSGDGGVSGCAGGTSEG
jgi:hypothetical protein